MALQVRVAQHWLQIVLCKAVALGFWAGTSSGIRALECWERVVCRFVTWRIFVELK